VKAFARNSLAGIVHASGFGTLLRRLSRRSYVILCYHRVLPDDARNDYPFSNLAVTPAALTAHVEYCRRHYECVPLREGADRLRAGKYGRKPLLSITFDDGYWDNYQYARPILNSQGVRATFFVITSLIGSRRAPWYDRLGRAATLLKDSDGPTIAQGDCDPDVHKWIAQWLERGRTWSVQQLVNEAKKLDVQTCDAIVSHLSRATHARDWEDDERDRIMTGEQLAHLAADGHEVGSHSRTHPILTRLTTDQLSDELNGSRVDLVDLLGTEVVSFCYPNGDFNEAVIGAIRRAGYKFATTTRVGLNGRSADSLRLRRLFVSQDRLSRADGQCSKSLLALELAGGAETLFLRRLRRGRSA